MLRLTAENRRDLGTFARFLSGHRRKVLAVAFTMLAAILIQLPVPFLTMVVIDRLVTAKDLSMLPLVFAGLLFFALFAALVSLGHTLVLGILREQVLGTLELRLIERLQHARTSFHYEHASGYLAARVHSDLRGLNAILVGAMLNALQNLLLVVSGTVSLFVLSWRLALITMACLPLVALAVAAFNRELRALSQVVQEAGARFGSQLQESLAGIQLVKAFGAEALTRARLRDQLLGLIRHVLKQEMLGALAHRLTGLMGTVVPLLLMWFGVNEMSAGRLSVGQFVAFNSFLGYVFSPALALLNQNVQFQTALVALHRLTELLDLPGEESAEAPQPMPRRHDLRFERVAFGYRTGASILTGLDLAVGEGESVALVGASGEGKTTLLRLLLRFHEPDGGRLLLGGADARTLPLQAYRSRFAVVFQEPFLFSGTVEDNLRVGNPRATRRQLDEALELACADAFVAALPQGYHTRLAEGGVTLSAGQKMRLAIARALLRDAPVVLLDEPTSALDRRTEQTVLRNLGRRLSGRTLVLISHQSAAVGLASRVCLLKGGRVVECLSREAYLAGLEAKTAALPAAQPRPAESGRASPAALLLGPSIQGRPTPAHARDGPWRRPEERR